MVFSTKMKIVLSWLVAGLLGCAAAAAQADIIVTSDSGTIGTFDLINNGGGSMTLKMDGTEMLTNINGAAVGPFTANFDATVAMTVSPGLFSHEYTISTATLSATFTDATPSHGQAILNYTLTGAETGTLLTDNAVLGGPILGVIANGFSGYNFSGISGNQNLALTSTHYAGGAFSMESVFQTSGASAEGSIAFSQANTPLATHQPSTLVMSATGLIAAGVLTFCRRRKSPVARGS